LPRKRQRNEKNRAFFAVRVGGSPLKQIVPEIYILDCKNALPFYKETFGGTIKNLQMSDDNALFRGMQGKVIHAELHVSARCLFYFADIVNPKRSKVGNITIMLHMDTPDEMEKTYNALRGGGFVGMPLQETLTGDLHAIVTDRYGAPWSLHYAKR
jgi:PhnB protein